MAVLIKHYTENRGREVGVYTQRLTRQNAMCPTGGASQGFILSLA